MTFDQALEKISSAAPGQIACEIYIAISSIIVIFGVIDYVVRRISREDARTWEALLWFSTVVLVAVNAFFLSWFSYRAPLKQAMAAIATEAVLKNDESAVVEENSDIIVLTRKDSESTDYSNWSAAEALAKQYQVSEVEYNFYDSAFIWKLRWKNAEAVAIFRDFWDGKTRYIATVSGSESSHLYDKYVNGVKVASNAEVSDSYQQHIEVFDRYGGKKVYYDRIDKKSSSKPSRLKTNAVLQNATESVKKTYDLGMALRKLTKYGAIINMNEDSEFLSILSITFGQYDWLVLEEKDGMLLILAENVTEQRPYGPADAEENCRWESCELRQYLNGEFYKSFTKEEQSIIVETEIDGGYDKVFLLSDDEVITYRDQFKKAYFEGSEAAWWIRGYSLGMKYLDSGGYDGHYTNDPQAVYGVRPALWLKP